MMNKQQAARELVEIGKRLYAKGMVAANDGNISIRLDERQILITPSGVSKGFMKAEEMVRLDSEGRVLSRFGQPSSEAYMHLEIYKNRTDINSICHAHPPYATAFAATGKTMRTDLLSEVAIALGEIPLVKFAVPGTPALAAALIPYLKEHVALLLANHGVVTLGESALQAYYRMETVEHAAKIQYLAQSLGQPLALSRQQLEQIKRAEKEKLIEDITRDILENLNSGKDE